MATAALIISDASMDFALEDEAFGGKLLQKEVVISFIEVDCSASVDLWVAYVFFKEQCPDCLPSFVSVGMHHC